MGDLGAGPLTASCWLLGRDYGKHEHAQQQPFVGRAGELLIKALRAAGWERQHVRIDNLVPKRPPGDKWEAHRPEDVLWGKQRLTQLLAQHRPKLIVALGAEVSRFLLEEHWPRKPDGKEEGILNVRGYLWDTKFGRVLTTVHPAALLHSNEAEGGQGLWVPFRALLDIDMRRAAAEVRAECPPLQTCDVTVVTGTTELEQLLDAIRVAKWVAVDIENTENLTLACIGFAPSVERAWVFPATARWHGTIKSLCESATPKVLQNGQYDRFFLRRFCGIELRNQVFDTQLAWHALQPELAGKSQRDKVRKQAYSRRTVKSLKFLASIYERVAWYKDYDFASEDDRYVLCGKDCCVTLSIAGKQVRQLK